MSKVWIIVNEEFDTPYVDHRSKVFYDSGKCYHKLMEINMLPENRARLAFNARTSNSIRPDNAYGLHYPYNMREIELES
jgi:hypothetical protein